MAHLLWLRRRLNRIGVDGDVCADYLMCMLDDAEDGEELAREYLTELTGGNDLESARVIAELTAVVRGDIVVDNSAEDEEAAEERPFAPLEGGDQDAEHAHHCDHAAPPAPAADMSAPLDVLADLFPHIPTDVLANYLADSGGNVASCTDAILGREDEAYDDGGGWLCGDEGGDWESEEALLDLGDGGTDGGNALSQGETEQIFDYKRGRPVCMYFSVGICRRGSACNFNHCDVATLEARDAEAQGQQGLGMLQNNNNVPPTEALRPSICRYYALGKCYRADCAFAHVDRLHAAAAPVICRFWLAGGCARGADCEFAHVSAPNAASGIAVDDSAPGITQPTIAASPPPPAALEFPALVTHAGVAGVERPQTNPGLDFRQAASLGASKRPAPQQRSGIAVAAPARPVRLLPSSSSSVPWVETGAAVAEQYQKTRAEAIALLAARNRLYQEASTAYSRGFGANARHLAREARELDAEMRRLHTEAAGRMFAERNGAGLVRAGAQLQEMKSLPWVRRRCVDLHGLHADEAVAVLEACIETMRAVTAGERSPHFDVITGTGHHARWDGRARVQPAVQKALRNMGVSFADASTDGRAGLLRLFM